MTYTGIRLSVVNGFNDCLFIYSAIIIVMVIVTTVTAALIKFLM
jgi:hypothetical protein